jgi:hypothetical protein
MRASMICQVSRMFLTIFADMFSGKCPSLLGYARLSAHVKSSMMGCSLTVPIRAGRLSLGIWQVWYNYSFAKEPRIFFFWLMSFYCAEMSQTCLFYRCQHAVLTFGFRWIYCCREFG